MDDKDKCVPGSMRVPLNERDKKYFNLMKVVICMKLERRITLLMSCYHPSFCAKCGTIHDELITFQFNYN